MSENELRLNAKLVELEQQRNFALTRCAEIAAELAVTQMGVQTLTTQNEKQAAELAALKTEKEPLKAVG